MNSTIQLNGKTLFYNKWLEKGILFIEHIFAYRSNVLFTFEQLQWLYDLSDTEHLNYITLTRCLPNECKKKLNREQMTYTQPTYRIPLIDTEQKICKLVYKTLVKNKIPKSSNRAMTHWQDTFDDKELQRKQILTCPYTLTIVTKLCAFQYKYILKILLFFINIVLYHPVFMTRDLLSHVYWECHIIQAFWRNVTVFLQNKLSINIELSYKNISFCNDSYPNVNGKDKSVSINFI